jgi:fructoselysine-6-P-deglycase FrlB-like protein
MREAFHVIAEDELRHGPKDIVEVAAKIETEEDLEKAVAALREYAKRHLRMRNETFGHPLSEQRLEEIDRGVVTPLQVDYTNISPISPYSM